LNAVDDAMDLLSNESKGLHHAFMKVFKKENFTIGIKKTRERSGFMNQGRENRQSYTLGKEEDHMNYWD
jgi:hypothetical protein